ncbi:MAG: hypothetical protein RIC14_10485 [Filomicrobium sp.]
MKVMVKYFVMAFVALALPFAAQSASAAEPRMPDQATQSLNGETAQAPLGLLAQAKSQPEKIVVAGRRGRRLGAAIVGGVIAGALIAGAARAHRYDHYDYDRRYYHRRRYRNRCDRWLWKCDNGNRRACRKFDYNCD